MTSVVSLQITANLLFMASLCFELCKPRVVALILLTAIVGMLLASNTWIALSTFIWAV